MKKVSVLQSNYIPWKGYFDIINDVDTFIFYDDVQFTKNDWRNRNKIKTNNGTQWLSIPVGSDLKRLIREVPITSTRWAVKHWKTIEQFYHKAPYFNYYKDFFRHIYLDLLWDNLSKLNQYLIKSISTELLGVKTVFEDSHEYVSEGERNERLVDLLQKAGTGIYISGPSAKSYIDENKFIAAGISLVYKDYSNYPEYPQFYPPFTHNVTILDLLFHTGPKSPYYIWGWRETVRHL